MLRVLPPAAGGSVKLASGLILIVHIATLASGRAAQECGGGAGARKSARWPATTITSVVRPSELRTVYVGIWWSHSIPKWGSTNLAELGRFNQIWKSSSGLGFSRLSSGNISE